MTSERIVVHYYAVAVMGEDVSPETMGSWQTGFLGNNNVKGGCKIDLVVFWLVVRL